MKMSHETRFIFPKIVMNVLTLRGVKTSSIVALPTNFKILKISTIHQILRNIVTNELLSLAIMCFFLITVRAVVRYSIVTIVILLKIVLLVCD